MSVVSELFKTVPKTGSLLHDNNRIIIHDPVAHSTWVSLHFVHMEDFWGLGSGAMPVLTSSLPSELVTAMSLPALALTGGIPV